MDNVWEWTLDSSGNYYTSGGSWSFVLTWDLQSDDRYRYYPDRSNYSVGFRCGSSAQDSK